MLGIASKIRLNMSHYKRIARLFEGFGSDGNAVHTNFKKSVITKALDYLYIFFFLKMMPTNYHLFGFEGKKRSEFKKYIGEPWEEPFVRRKIGKLWKNGIILRDKQLFKIICDYYNLPIPRHYGFLSAGNLFCGKEDISALVERFKPKRLVLKPATGQNGVGIQFFEPQQLNTILVDPDLRKETYIIEEAIEQHPDLDQINPNSVNSIRLITLLLPDGNVELLAAMLKASASKVPVDNFSLGGIAVAIDLETGKLRRDGHAKFYSPDFVINNRKSTDPETIKDILSEIHQMRARYHERVFTHHPLTNFKFESFQLPFWKDVVHAAMRAQQVFSYGKANAIDIAITSQGPVILEANEGWGTTGIQAACGGLLTEKNRRLFAQFGIRFY